MAKVRNKRRQRAAGRIELGLLASNASSFCSESYAEPPFRFDSTFSISVLLSSSLSSLSTLSTLSGRLTLSIPIFSFDFDHNRLKLLL